MKKIFLVLGFIFSIILANTESNNSSESKFSLAKKDNLSIDAIYKREFKSDVDINDLKTYFKNGNTIGVNFTYLIGDKDKKENFKNNIYITNLSSNNKRDIKYDLKDTKLKTTVHKINEINLNNVQFKVTKKENKNKIESTLTLLNRYGKKLQIKYGKISNDKIIVKENKKDKLVITFDGSNLE